MFSLSPLWMPQLRSAGISFALNALQCSELLDHNSWILDSGASEHMSSNREALHDLSLLRQPVQVNLPNGSRVRVRQQGKLKVTLVLFMFCLYHTENCFYCQKRLCQQLKCEVKFTETVCIIEGPSQRRPLVIGKEMLGLYVMDKSLIQAILLPPVLLN